MSDNATATPGNSDGDYGKFAVLFSHASSAVYDELVTTHRFSSDVGARVFGDKIAYVQGVEYEVMELTADGWRSARGESPVEVIRRRWQGR
ncbi:MULTISPECIES: hypothetical protein [Mycolicibacterium]|uniref:hypothetical protein n=1 Tax=Mycolicibacterium TaxID=1866885 RepID=UPI0011633A84|nr:MULTISPECIES: hypothetical protein [Mycolicibacterium]MCC9181051.1 hypothetical protein [Mycolicibacterium mageritense]QDF19332.1 hypothetical protein SEA_CRACKLEWINK_46 [Mycobacterium phage Cracklewink]UBV14771.1 hypothetical protein H8Z57_29415 [Mycolicibacterium fortuitum]